MLKHIIITVLLITANLLVFPQENDEVVQLSGFVRNDSLKPIPLVHVYVYHKARGTISDFRGYYSLAVEQGDTIVFSSLGYKTRKFIVPDTLTEDKYHFDVKIISDTILLKEAVVYPYMTYEQFKEAFVSVDIPDDDYERAQNNMDLIEKQIKYAELPPDPELAYNQYMHRHYQSLYYAGQFPSVSLLNPFAWAKFFKALQDGDFKQVEE
mgnify:CR=1 FL=1